MAERADVRAFYEMSRTATTVMRRMHLSLAGIYPITSQ
jgi:hypothetical protein